jgi:hypothetical protein
MGVTPLVGVITISLERDRNVTSERGKEMLDMV